MGRFIVLRFHPPEIGGTWVFFPEPIRLAAFCPDSLRSYSNHYFALVLIPGGWGATLFGSETRAPL